MTINKVLRQLVRERAKFLCEYCHSPEWSSVDLFTLEHIRPQSKGGFDELDNLALACRRCNEHPPTLFMDYHPSRSRCALYTTYTSVRSAALSFIWFLDYWNFYENFNFSSPSVALVKRDLPISCFL